MTQNSFTTRTDLPTELPNKRTFFCIVCGAVPVTKVKKENGTTVYFCEACRKESERFIAWDPSMGQYFNTNNELVHESVGVIIQNLKKEVLLFKRVKYPFLWTIPAGHVDVGEDKKQTAKRELMEETQIVAENLQLVFKGEIRGDSCVGGADVHFWHAYVNKITYSVQPTIDREEGGEWAWFSIDQLPAVTWPVRYLFDQAEVKAALS